MKTKPNYKNWVPKTMLYLLGLFALLCYAITLFTLRLLDDGIMKTLLCAFFLIGGLVFTAILIWMTRMYRAFSYNGTRQLSREIIEGIAEYVNVVGNGTVLDVGCGSGALTIAVAKRNPTAHVTGIDRWGIEYGSYNKQLCEYNAQAENVHNVTFKRGDAVMLDFPDECFDAVTSNYVYHNIIDVNRQDVLLETLRVLKKGGTFVLHDIFSVEKYGDMDSFTQHLKLMGYEYVELIDTTDGMFMTKKEAYMYSLAHSAILYGKK